MLKQYMSIVASKLVTEKQNKILICNYVVVDTTIVIEKRLCQLRRVVYLPKDKRYTPNETF